jgi:hypothetical protein
MKGTMAGDCSSIECGSTLSDSINEVIRANKVEAGSRRQMKMIRLFILVGLANIMNEMITLD